MPNHVHLLISESSKGTPSVVLKVLKQRVSRDLRRSRRRAPAGQLHFAFTKGNGSLPCFWQPRFYDFNVWSKKKVREKLDYMHANPVTRKLVHHPKDWRGAVGRSMRRAKPAWFPSTRSDNENLETTRTKAPHVNPTCRAPKFPSRLYVRATRPESLNANPHARPRILSKICDRISPGASN
jgi:REP element-mobilizing transposase RayT